MRKELIAYQVVRLIGAFPEIASKLSDLGDNSFNTPWRLAQAAGLLINSNMTFVARTESDTRRTSLSPNELKYLEENLMSLVDRLVARPKKTPDLSQYHLLTELESVFITLYKILQALEKKQLASKLFCNARMPTILLFVIAAELSQHLSAVSADTPFNTDSFRKVHMSTTGHGYTMTEWNKWTVIMLSLLNILRHSTSDIREPALSFDNYLIRLASNGRLDKFVAFMKSDELTTASAVRNNISELLLYAIMNKHYDTADYLLGIYEDAAWYWNPKEDLSRPSSENSLLALALMFDQINIATRIVALQEGPYFNKTDRDLVVPIPDSEWNDPIKQQEKKPIAGFTLLHIMAQYNLATLIEPFIEQTGINPNEKTYYSKATPLIIAEIYDSNDAVKVLNEINAPANNDGTCERPAKKAKTEIS